MKDERKTKAQLISELAELRQRVAELETAEAGLKQAEENLQASVQQWHATFDAISDAICLLDPEGRVLQCNKGMSTFLGKPSSEIIGRHCWELMHGTSGPIDGCPSVRMQETLRRETMVLSIDDQWVNVTTDPLLDEAGNLAKVVHIIRDITERKQAEAALRESEERFRGVFENSAVGVYRTTPDGQIILANPALVDILGFSSFEELAKRDLEKSGFAPEYPRSYFKQRIASEGKIIGLESTWTRKDGTSLYVRENAQLVRDEAGNALYYDGTVEDITERVRAEEALRQRNRELTALNRASRTLTSTLNLNQVLDTVLEEVRSLMDVTACSVWLTDAETGELVCFEPAGPKNEIVRGWRLAPGNGLAGWVASHGESLIVPDVRANGRYFKGVDEQTGLGLRSVLTMPLYAKDEVIGVLQVLDTEVGRFSAADLEPLEALVASAAIAIENARLYQAAQQEITERKRAEQALALRVEQLAALSQASQAVTASLKLDQVLAEIVSLTSKVMASDYGTVLLIDEAGHIGQTAEDLPGVLSIEYRVRDEGLTDWIVRSGQAAVIDEIGEDGVIASGLGPGAPRYANPHIVEAGIKSIAGLPLIARGNLLGVLYLHSLRPGAFRDQLPLLTTFANQAAIAIENARLYEAAQQELAERQRAEEASRASREYARSIVDSSLDTIITVDVDRRIVEFNQAAQETFGYQAEEILGKHIDMLYAHPQEGIEVHQTTIEKGRCVREVAGLRKGGDVFPSLISASVLRDADGELVGVMGVSRDVTERKRAEEALRQRTAQLEALREVGLEITAQLDPDTLLHSIASWAMGMMKGASAGVCLYRPEQDVLETIATVGDAIAPIGSALRRGESVSGRVWETGEPVVVDDYQHWAGRIATYEGLPIGAMVSVPICWGETFLGVLTVASDSPHAFTQTDAELLSLFATQTAIAIRNVRLYEAEQERVNQLALLNRAGQTLTSTLNLGQILNTVLEEVRRLMDIIACSIWLIDRETDELVCLQSTGPQNELVRGWRLAPGQGICGWVALHGESLIVPDVWADERYFRGVDEQTELGLRSILTVPLRVKEDVTGVLQVLDTEANRFGAADLAVLEPLVASAAIAIENARLYEQARQDAETKSTLLREVNHRVKNNLTAIIGLLHAERSHAAAEDQAIYQPIMQNLVNRVQGLATVHSLLSASEWAPLSLSELTTQVIHSSLQMLPRDRRVSVDVTPSPARVTSDQAHNLALVINELTTNTVKHGVQEQGAARISVRIELDGDTVALEFRDNGPGYSEEVLQLEYSNVGFDLIQNIVSKNLRGELSLHNDRGAVAVIRFEAKT